MTPRFLFISACTVLLLITAGCGSSCSSPEAEGPTEDSLAEGGSTDTDETRQKENISQTAAREFATEGYLRRARDRFKTNEWNRELDILEREIDTLEREIVRKEGLLKRKRVKSSGN